ncbi:lytic polysaccharide monooxygenase [Karstenula rhodostoma CBS 690.94]|uniref:lytic cellulose monooxygenase (C4-dehydrogenating) n=1 Tax=Karstenula rhodostoma CBS 690.94 TaxID=1392251 RepID=A0A9P4UIF5_9PLEO|nr:lytic polysaccharide monooxygenase [Karstenula rhodostoma CBS 690.94]
MRLALCFTLVLASIYLTSAHYNFPYLLVNETFSPVFLYTRRVSDETHAGNGPSYPPFHEKDLESPDIRCGRDATVSGVETDVATIVAGSKVGFRPNFWIRNTTGFFGLVLHDGPLAAYLARSPIQTKKGLQAWDGASGAFFKIAERGPTTNERWFTDEELQGVQFSEYNFTVPVRTPPGFYLMRMDSLLPRGGNWTQFYAGCAQVEIVGQGGGSEPQPTVNFPVLEEMRKEYLAKADSGQLLGYKMPGPSVWKG